MDKLIQQYLPFILPVLIIMATLLLAYLFRRLFNRFILQSDRLRPDDPTRFLFLKHFISGVIYLVGFSLAVYHIEPLKTMAGSLLAGAGILAVAVGFASQHALSNIISGIFIIIFKPFRVNDRITIRDTLSGIVEDITLRHTVIRDFQNRRIVIPNSIISEEVVINADLTDERVCRHVEVGITYESDIQKAKSILRELVLAHPSFVDPRNNEEIESGEHPVQVRVINFAESAITLRAWAWAANQADGFVMHCDLFESIKARFDESGIDIAYPHRVVVLKEPNALPRPETEDKS